MLCNRRGKTARKIRINQKGKKQILVDCASFYEEKALDYILASLPKAKQKEFTKDPVIVEFLSTPQDNRDVSFGDNIVYIWEELLKSNDKKTLFFKFNILNVLKEGNPSFPCLFLASGGCQQSCKSHGL